VCFGHRSKTRSISAVRCRVCAPSLVVIEWQVPVLASPILAVCDWEGTACGIAQDVVRNDVHVRLKSGPGHPAIGE
jgi:hypothetical protein